MQVLDDEGVNIAFMGSGVTGVVPLLTSTEGQPHRVLRREGYFTGEELGKVYMKQMGFKYPPGRDTACVSKKGKQNRIQKENAKPGTRDWLLTKNNDTAEPTTQHPQTQIKGTIQS